MFYLCYVIKNKHYDSSVFIQQFDLSFLRVTLSDYVSYLRQARTYSSLVHKVEYCYFEPLPFHDGTVMHFLRIYKSWL